MTDNHTESLIPKKCPNQVLFHHTLTSPLGELTLASNQSHLVSLTLGKKLADQPSFTPDSVLTLFQCCQTELTLYFEGKLRSFSIPLHPEGTSFQKKAWQALLKIPFGETQSYQAQASMIQKPKAYRAIGHANALNPLPILIPCHRVIHKNGNTGNYIWGKSVKQWLLQHEHKQTHPQ